MSTATITQQQLSTAIARLQDLGDRLETAEALSESHVQPKDWLIAAYCLGGPAGILVSMWIHPWMVRKFGRKS